MFDVRNYNKHVRSLKIYMGVVYNKLLIININYLLGPHVQDRFAKLNSAKNNLD